MSAAATTAAARWKLYGLPLSQPFRSVAWALLQNRIRFDVQLTVPGSDGKIGSRNETYMAKSRMRTTRIPLLEDTHSGFTIAESPAILSHLCERYGWEDTLYGPPGSPKKATIDSYMHWHHTGTRKVAKMTFGFLRPDLGEPSNQGKIRDQTLDTLRDLEEGWFANVSTTHDDLFVAGGTKPSIADLMAYEDVVQLTMLGLIEQELFQQSYPKIQAWMQRMEQVPFHEEVHAALATLGDVTVETDLPFPKRLGSANKKGLQVLAEAQEGFPNEQPQSKL